MVSKPKELLDIFLITYNRDVHLDYTLKQLVNCPFARFSITILDNCSTDSTYQVFVKHSSQIPTLKYIKNKVNIGADANVLRGAELSEGLYTWILADDDEYNFTDCENVFEVLEKGEADAIMVGCSDVFIWPKKALYDTPANLIQKNFSYFGVPSFVPGSIFKTELFQNQIRISYTNIINLFPVMTYYVKLYNESALIYVSKVKIVNATANAAYHYSFLRVMSGLVNTFYLIDSYPIRKKTLKQVYPNVTYKILIDYALLMKEPLSPMSFNTVVKYFRLLDWKHKVVFATAYLGSPIVSKLITTYRNLKK